MYFAKYRQGLIAFSSVLLLSVGSVAIAAGVAVPAADAAAPAAAPVVIEQSPNDLRRYQYLELANGLRTLMISDPAADKASASLDVNVGSGSDPADRQGLAHFLEHLLFLGTEKYPDADEYKKFISDHGGSDNAYTALEHTNYYFDVDKDFLRPALERFAQFFIAPLFNARYVERERQVVHSEFQSKLRSDGWRARSALRAVINPEHPSSGFSVGSADTLAERDGEPPVRERLIEFYRQHYSADLMTLVVLGREPLATLQLWVEEHFSAVPRRTAAAAPAVATVPLFLEGQLPQRLDVVPVKNTRQLTLQFPVPPPRPHYRAKPLSYLSNLIGDETAGSLLSLLKARGWVESLWAGTMMSDSNGATFGVSMELTPQGLQQIDAITAQVFAYLRLIRATGVERWRFEQQRRLSEIAFRFQEPASPLATTRGLAAALHYYPPSQVLQGGYLMDQFDPALIEQYLDQLRPDNALLSIVAPEITALADQTAERFQTPYRVLPIAPELLARWHQEPAAEALALAAPNPFIPQQLTLHSPATASALPELIKSAPAFEFWHQQDDTFRIPKAEFYFSVRSPRANDSAEHAVLTQLFARLVNDSLAEYSYPAYLAGLGYSLYKHMRGFSVRISGYDEQQQVLLQRILDVLQAPRFDPERFLTIKNDLRRDIENGREDPPYQRAYEEVANLLTEPLWSDQQRLQALAGLTLDDLQAFIPELLRQRSLTALAYGNLDRRRALQLADTLQKRLMAGAEPVEVARGRALRLGEGVDRALLLDNRSNDSALLVYYQGSNQDLASRARYALLGDIIGEPFFDDLRTENKLGYIVSASALPIMRAPGLAFVVQSPSADPATLAGHVERFLRHYEGELSAMTEQQFRRHRQSLLTQVLQREKTLQQRASRYWAEIDRRKYNFDTRERFADAVRGISREQLLALYQRELLGPQRSRLSVRALGSAHAASGGSIKLSAGPETSGAEPALIEDPVAFKLQRPAFPGSGTL